VEDFSARRLISVCSAAAKLPQLPEDDDVDDEAVVVIVDSSSVLADSLDDTWDSRLVDLHRVA
jgi:hypothetical protein